MEFCDGHAGDWKTHISRNDDCHEQVQSACCAPIDQMREPGSAQQNSDSHAHDHSPLASGNSTESRKTGRDPVTTSPYMLSVQSAGGIRDKSALLALFVRHVSTHGNNILPDAMDAHLLERIPHRIVGTVSSAVSEECECAFYEQTTINTGHFATFPERLVAPCIKAGTSERGACPACGAPWVREVAVKHLLIQATNNRGKQDEVTGWNRDKWPRMARIGDTTGWRPSCECEAGDPVPCVVLDPFAGSGTTGVVAHKLGRAFVGIDIAGGDADLGGHTAHERLAAALAGRTLAEYQQARAVGQGDLFGASNP